MAKAYIINPASLDLNLRNFDSSGMTKEEAEQELVIYKHYDDRDIGEDNDIEIFTGLHADFCRVRTSKESKEIIHNIILEQDKTQTFYISGPIIEDYRGGYWVLYIEIKTSIKSSNSKFEVKKLVCRNFYGTIYEALELRPIDIDGLSIVPKDQDYHRFQEWNYENEYSDYYYEFCISNLLKICPTPSQSNTWTIQEAPNEDDNPFCPKGYGLLIPFAGTGYGLSMDTFRVDYKIKTKTPKGNISAKMKRIGNAKIITIEKDREVMMIGRFYCPKPWLIGVRAQLINDCGCLRIKKVKEIRVLYGSHYLGVQWKDMHPSPLILPDNLLDIDLSRNFIPYESIEHDNG